MTPKVSVLFSEPKIPQSFDPQRRLNLALAVSVLFSEPKIPQCERRRRRRAVNVRFQCSSASRKFLNWMVYFFIFFDLVSFSALQRAENSSIARRIRLTP